MKESKEDFILSRTILKQPWPYFEILIDMSISLFVFINRYIGISETAAIRFFV